DGAGAGQGLGPLEVEVARGAAVGIAQGDGAVERQPAGDHQVRAVGGREVQVPLQPYSRQPTPRGRRLKRCGCIHGRAAQGATGQIERVAVLLVQVTVDGEDAAGEGEGIVDGEVLYTV